MFLRKSFLFLEKKEPNQQAEKLSFFLRKIHSEVPVEKYNIRALLDNYISKKN